MVRTAAAELVQIVKRARAQVYELGAPDLATIKALRLFVALTERDLLRAGNYAPHPRATRPAQALLVLHDPDHATRMLKLDEIDRLTIQCDDRLDIGLVDAAQLRELGAAVLEFEQAYSCGADAHATATAWDVLAQAEAGLGQPVEPTHYEQARRRHSHWMFVATGEARSSVMADGAEALTPGAARFRGCRLPRNPRSRTSSP